MSRSLGLFTSAQIILTSSDDGFTDSFADSYGGLSGTGNGQALLGPVSPGEIWQPAVVSVGTNESVVTNEAQCKIYCGPTAEQPFYVDGTLSGSTGDSSANVGGQTLYPGQFIIAVWTGGDDGAAAYLNVQGSRQVPLWAASLTRSSAAAAPWSTRPS